MSSADKLEKIKERDRGRDGERENTTLEENCIISQATEMLRNFIDT